MVDVLSSFQGPSPVKNNQPEHISHFSPSLPDSVCIILNSGVVECSDVQRIHGFPS